MVRVAFRHRTGSVTVTATHRSSISYFKFAFCVPGTNRGQQAGRSLCTVNGSYKNTHFLRSLLYKAGLERPFSSCAYHRTTQKAGLRSSQSGTKDTFVLKRTVYTESSTITQLMPRRHRAPSCRGVGLVLVTAAAHQACAVCASCSAAGQGCQEPCRLSERSTALEHALLLTQRKVLSFSSHVFHACVA